MQIKQGADELISLAADSRRLIDQIMVEAGAMQQDMVEIQSIIEEIRQQPGTEEVPLACWAQSEDIMARVHRTYSTENDRAQEMKNAAHNLADLGGRLKFFTDRLKI
jgi:citrate synthase